MGSDPFIAEIVLFAGNFAPRGWAFCDGQLLSISQNTALFSLLGTTYGGDGRTNFALPDLRGRVSMHPGSGPGLTTRRLGEKSGTETHTLTVNQMPAHTHAIQPRCDDTEGTAYSPKGHFPAKTPVADGNPPGYGGNGADQMGSSTSDATGGGQAVNHVQPYLGINYIIALIGVFPEQDLRWTVFNRRNFLGSAAGGFAGGVLALHASANPMSLLQSPATTRDYLPVGLRWTGTGLEVISAHAAGIGDLLAFQRTGGGDQPIDLFLCDVAPPGHAQEAILRPLGRHATWPLAQQAGLAGLQTHVMRPPDADQD